MPGVPLSKSAVITISIAAVALAVAFFLPWVTWDKTPITGSAIANGRFFATTETEFGLANPFPAVAPLMKALWLLPVMAVLSVVLVWWLRRPTVVPVLAGMIGMGLATLYILFSGSLVDLGVEHAMQPGLVVCGLASVVLIVAATRNWLLRIALVAIIPLATYAGFRVASSQVEGQEFELSANLESAFTVGADALIAEFKANDSVANAKYREKLVTVTGQISGLETGDSTATLKFADSTGSYIIFPFQDEEATRVSKLKEGETVTVKGSCSGGIYSEILESETISFKRCTIIKP